MNSNNKILVVEDDAPIRTMYELKLKNSKFAVKSAKNGIEGLAIAQEFLPNLMLVDLRMPDMSGDEMLTKLREHNWGAKIRIIILTNISKDEAPQTLRMLHVDRYIVKAHHTPAQIVDIVKDVLSIKD